jgi:hypothetical protein
MGYDAAQPSKSVPICQTLHRNILRHITENHNPYTNSLVNIKCHKSLGKYHLQLTEDCQPKTHVHNTYLICFRCNTVTQKFRGGTGVGRRGKLPLAILLILYSGRNEQQSTRSTCLPNSYHPSGCLLPFPIVISCITA